MRRIWYLVGALGGIMTTSALNPIFANSNIKILYSNGAWSTLFGLSPQKRPICMMVGGRGQKTIAYLSVRGTPFIVADLQKKSWSIPPGTNIYVQIQVDEDAPFVAVGTGSGDNVKWRIQGRVLRNYAREFAQGRELVISFRGGNEPPWVISLAGSAGATEVFGKCISAIEARTPEPPTQPYSPAPTQPYAAPSKPPPAPPPSGRAAPATPGDTISPPTGYKKV